MTGDHNDYIDSYIPYSEKADKFVLSVIEKWPEFFEYSVGELKDDTVEKISYILVNYCDEETLKRVNIIDNSSNEGVLTSFISSRPNYLSKEYEHDAECRALSLLNVSFKEINYDCAINELFDYVSPYFNINVFTYDENLKTTSLYGSRSLNNYTSFNNVRIKR